MALDTPGTEAACHCGAVRIALAVRPVEVTECNCSLCRSYGVLWIYCDEADVSFIPATPATDTYAWNGRNVDFHRCVDCGCVTHWTPRDAARSMRGVNARLLPATDLEAARVRHLDGADTKEYLD